MLTQGPPKSQLSPSRQLGMGWATSRTGLGSWSAAKATPSSRSRTRPKARGRWSSSSRSQAQMTRSVSSGGNWLQSFTGSRQSSGKMENHLSILYLVCQSTPFSCYLFSYFREPDLRADKTLCDGHQARSDNLAPRGQQREDRKSILKVYRHQNTFWIRCSRYGSAHRSGFEKNR